MASVTFSIPSDTKADMKSMPWVNWSETVAEELNADLSRQKTLHKLDELLKHSEVSDEDILEWSKKARKGRFNELKSKGLV